MDWVFGFFARCDGATMAGKRLHKSRRGKGRAARMSARAAPQSEVNPCPPGQRGGRYRPLSERDIEQIVDAAFRILEEIGMNEAPPVLKEKAMEKGAALNDMGRLSYSRTFTEDIIDGAAKRFVFHGRDPKYDFEIGDERVYFGTGGAAVQTLDIDSGQYRPSTLRDLYDFARLVDTLENVSWFTRCCVATDVPDNFDL
ncbi:MAG: trimethylamine methyltransferase family protein, partial [Gammaproteobacteria bacterium]|nr:trimethylamine methyltransferase family protein [Gammaproteobacteria bacterium]